MPGSILTGQREFRGCTAAHGIADPRGDIAGDPAAGYGRFRFRPNIIRHIIIFGVSIRENQALMDTV